MFYYYIALLVSAFSYFIILRSFI